MARAQGRRWHRGVLAAILVSVLLHQPTALQAACVPVIADPSRSSVIAVGPPANSSACLALVQSGLCVELAANSSLAVQGRANGTASSAGPFASYVIVQGQSALQQLRLGTGAALSLSGLLLLDVPLASPAVGATTWLQPLTVLQQPGSLLNISDSVISTFCGTLDGYLPLAANQSLGNATQRALGLDTSAASILVTRFARPGLLITNSWVTCSRSLPAAVAGNATNATSPPRLSGYAATAAQLARALGFNASSTPIAAASTTVFLSTDVTLGGTATDGGTWPVAPYSPSQLSLRPTSNYTGSARAAAAGGGGAVWLDLAQAPRLVAWPAGGNASSGVEGLVVLNGCLTLVPPDPTQPQQVAAVAATLGAVTLISSPASLEHRLSVSNSTLVVPQDEVQLYQLWAVLTAVTSFRTPVLLNKPPFSSQASNFIDASRMDRSSITVRSMALGSAAFRDATLTSMAPNSSAFPAPFQPTTTVATECVSGGAIDAGRRWAASVYWIDSDATLGTVLNTLATYPTGVITSSMPGVSNLFNIYPNVLVLGSASVAAPALSSKASAPNVGRNMLISGPVVNLPQQNTTLGVTVNTTLDLRGQANIMTLSSTAILTLQLLALDNLVPVDLSAFVSVGSDSEASVIQRHSLPLFAFSASRRVGQAQIHLDSCTMRMASSDFLVLYLAAIKGSGWKTNSKANNLLIQQSEVFDLTFVNSTMLVFRQYLGWGINATNLRITTSTPVTGDSPDNSTVVPSTPTPSSDSGSSSSSTAAIVGGVVGGVGAALLIGAVLAVVLVRRRRRDEARRAQEEMDKEYAAAAANGGGGGGGPGGGAGGSYGEDGIKFSSGSHVMVVQGGGSGHNGGVMMNTGQFGHASWASNPGGKLSRGHTAGEIPSGDGLSNGMQRASEDPRMYQSNPGNNAALASINGMPVPAVWRQLCSPTAQATPGSLTNLHNTGGAQQPHHLEHSNGTPRLGFHPPPTSNPNQGLGGPMLHRASDRSEPLPFTKQSLGAGPATGGAGAGAASGGHAVFDGASSGSNNAPQGDANATPASPKSHVGTLPPPAPAVATQQAAAAAAAALQQQQQLDANKAMVAATVAAAAAVATAAAAGGVDTPSQQHEQGLPAPSRAATPAPAPPPPDQPWNPNRAVSALKDQLGHEDSSKLVLLEPIGQGGFGMVHRGKWRGLEVAIKTVLFSDKTSHLRGHQPGMPQQSAVLEAAVCSAVQHANVVATYHYDIVPVASTGQQAVGLKGLTVEDKNQHAILDYKLYLVQEFCNASLQDALRNQLLHDPKTLVPDLDLVLTLLMDIARGMQYIHSRNIIHGDLTPGNVLLKQDADSPIGVVAKITDFGLCSTLQPGQSHISNITNGTPFYVAPEVVKSGVQTKTSDVYSYGVLMWELFRCMPPWVHTEAGYAANKRFRRFPADAPRIYVYLCARCLCQKPKERPTFDEVLTEVSFMHKAFLAGYGATLQDPGSPSPMVAAATAAVQQQQQPQASGAAAAAGAGAPGSDKHPAAAAPPAQPAAAAAPEPPPAPRNGALAFGAPAANGAAPAAPPQASGAAAAQPSQQLGAGQAAEAPAGDVTGPAAPLLASRQSRVRSQVLGQWCATAATQRSAAIAAGGDAPPTSARGVTTATAYEQQSSQLARQAGVLAADGEGGEAAAGDEAAAAAAADGEVLGRDDVPLAVV